MPGSLKAAWNNAEMARKKMYAKRIGMAGETLCHSQGALKAKNSAAGRIVSTNVAKLSGFALVFKHRPERKKSMFPAKYS